MAPWGACCSQDVSQMPLLWLLGAAQANKHSRETAPGSNVLLHTQQPLRSASTPNYDQKDQGEQPRSGYGDAGHVGWASASFVPSLRLFRETADPQLGSTSTPWSQHHETAVGKCWHDGQAPHLHRDGPALASCE